MNFRISCEAGSRTFAALLAGALCAAPAAAAPPRYAIVDLGVLPGGGGFSRPYAISNDGHVVGAMSVGSGLVEAFMWRNGVLTDLGDLGAVHDNSYALGINDAGQAVGFSRLGDAPFEGPDVPFVWQSGVMSVLPGTQTNGVAAAINNGGTVVGAIGTPGDERAARWSGGAWSLLTGLTGVPGGARAINEAGQIAGTYEQAGGTHGFLWEAGVVTDLRDLPGGDDFTLVNALSEIGWVVGESAGADARHAFLWRAGIGMVDLGVLPSGGGLGSASFGVNASGWVVGESGVAGPVNKRAFLWSGDTGMLDLNELLGPAAGWLLTSAFAINDAGWITGIGLNPDGQSRAFVLTPVPEARTLTLLLAGLLALGLRRGGWARAGRGRA